jgi:hypothetical protein
MVVERQEVVDDVSNPVRNLTWSFSYIMSMLCLNLPSSSDAFKDFHTPVKTNTEPQSPPRKIAKLHDDGGRGGASARSRLTERGKARVTLSFQDDGKCESLVEI